MLQKVGMQNLSSQLDETSFEGWRDRASKAVDGLARKGLNSIVILGAWTLEPKKSLCVRWSFTKSK
jgi:nuclear pore complex protein Nup210